MKLSPLGVSRLDLVLCSLFLSLSDLVCRCRRVISSCWFFGDFGLSFVYDVAVYGFDMWLCMVLSSSGFWIQHMLLQGFKNERLSVLVLEFDYGSLSS